MALVCPTVLVAEEDWVADKEAVEVVGREAAEAVGKEAAEAVGKEAAEVADRETAAVADRETAAVADRAGHIASAVRRIADKAARIEAVHKAAERIVAAVAPPDSCNCGYSCNILSR